MKVFVFILSDPELLQRQLLVGLLIINQSEFCPLSRSSRHSDHYNRLKGRATNMAGAAAPALQLAQLGGLQHLRGPYFILIFLCYPLRKVVIMNLILS